MAFEPVPKLNKHSQPDRRYVRFHNLGSCFRMGDYYWDLLGNPDNVTISYDPDTGQALVQASDSEFDQKVTGKRSQRGFHSKLLARRMDLTGKSQYLDVEWSAEHKGVLITKQLKKLDE